jgi:hypothetical protein
LNGGRIRRYSYFSSRDWQSLPLVFFFLVFLTCLWVPLPVLKCTWVSATVSTFSNLASFTHSLFLTSKLTRLCWHVPSLRLPNSIRNWMADGQEIIPITYRHCNCREFYSELNGGRIEISPVLHPSHDLLDNPNHVSLLQLPNPVRNWIADGYIRFLPFATI